ncbi:MAG: hypothetical protein PHN69_04700 [Candidatus Pacebacteria bacterium]|nr:hypothetical protein [Candidatus Paceibacterota bacterium]
MAKKDTGKEEVKTEKLSPEVEAIIKKIAINSGDLSKISPDERGLYYVHTCESLGMNPLTEPFKLITLNGKLTMYATRACTEQLRKVNKISLTIVSSQIIGDIYVVRVNAVDRDGRIDESTGAVSIIGLKSEALANAYMKTETKAKRRVTLSICGLGYLDETEVETIPGAVAGPAVILPKAKTEAETKIKPEVKAVPKTEAKTEVKPEVKAEVKPEAKTEAKTEVKPEVKAEVKPEAKTEAKTEVKAEVNPESEVKTKYEIITGLITDNPPFRKKDGKISVNMVIVSPREIDGLEVLVPEKFADLLFNGAALDLKGEFKGESFDATAVRDAELNTEVTEVPEVPEVPEALETLEAISAEALTAPLEVGVCHAKIQGTPKNGKVDIKGDPENPDKVTEQIRGLFCYSVGRPKAFLLGDPLEGFNDGDTVKITVDRIVNQNGKNMALISSCSKVEIAA